MVAAVALGRYVLYNSIENRLDKPNDGRYKEYTSYQYHKMNVSVPTTAIPLKFVSQNKHFYIYYFLVQQNKQAPRIVSYFTVIITC